MDSWKFCFKNGLNVFDRPLKSFWVRELWLHFQSAVSYVISKVAYTEQVGYCDWLLAVAFNGLLKRRLWPCMVRPNSRSRAFLLLSTPSLLFSPSSKFAWHFALPKCKAQNAFSRRFYDSLLVHFWAVLCNNLEATEDIRWSVQNRLVTRIQLSNIMGQKSK